MKKLESIVITGIGLELPARASSHWILGEDSARDADEPQVLLKKLKRRGLKYKDHATRLGLSAAQAALQDAGLPIIPEEQKNGTGIGVIAASNFGNIATILKTVNTIQTEHVNAVSPMDLPNASSNVIASTIAIWYGLKALNVFLCNGATSGADAIQMACRAIRAGRTEKMLVVGVEVYEEATRKFIKDSDANIDAASFVNIGAAVLLESSESAIENGSKIYCEVENCLKSSPEKIQENLNKYFKEGDYGEKDDKFVWFRPERLLQESISRIEGLSQEQIDMESIAGETFGVLGILQAVAAANWIKMKSDYKVLSTSGGIFNGNVCSLLYRHCDKLVKRQHQPLLSGNLHEWESRVEKINGYEVELAHSKKDPDSKEKPSILFIHGMVEDWDIWESLQKYLEDYDLWFLKFPWESSGGQFWGKELSPESWLRDGIDLMPRKPNMVVAHSFAANAFLELVSADNSVTPEKIVLISPFFRKTRDEIDWSVLSHYVNHFLELIQESVQIRDVSRRLDSEMEIAISEKIRERLGVYGWTEFLKILLLSPDLNFDSFETPVLVLTGESDIASRPINCEELAQIFPSGRAHVFKESGHFCMIEEPRKVAEEIINFLKKSLTQTRKDTINEMIELSDTIESQHETEFNEWRAFKKFRNTMRDKLNNLTNAI